MNHKKIQRKFFQYAKNLRIGLVQYTRKSTKEVKVGVTAGERRRAIWEAIRVRRHDKIQNLAFEFGVSRRTIEYDVERLSLHYPVYTTKGTGGGVHVEDWYKPDRIYLSEKEQRFLEQIGNSLSGEQKVMMDSIIKKFGIQRSA